MMVDRRSFISIAGLSLAFLAGCSGGDGGQVDGSSEVTSKDTGSESKDEQKQAGIGDEIEYTSAQGDGTFIVTVEGLERSEEMTEAFAQYGDVTDGYSVCLLLLIIKDVDVELNGSSTYLSKVWLEDSDGVSATPMNSALAYGEYAAAPGGAFTVSTGQAIRIAIPYQLPDGETSYDVMVDGTEVPVELVEGSRSIG